MEADQRLNLLQDLSTAVLLIGISCGRPPLITGASVSSSSMAVSSPES